MLTFQGLTYPFSKHGEINGNQWLPKIENKYLVTSVTNPQHCTSTTITVCLHVGTKSLIFLKHTEFVVNVLNRPQFPSRRAAMLKTVSLADMKDM